MNDGLQGVSTLETKKGHNWFLIQCSWEYDADSIALAKWQEVYDWFKPDNPKDIPPLREEIANEGLLALNLIGKRKFVIAGQAKSNKPLQELSSMITLNTPIKVDVFAATNVFEFDAINKDEIRKARVKAADP